MECKDRKPYDYNPVDEIYSSFNIDDSYDDQTESVRRLDNELYFNDEYEHYVLHGPIRCKVFRSI